MVNYAQTISPATLTIMNDGTSLLVRYEINNPSLWYIYNPRLFLGTEAELAALGNVDFAGDGTVYINSAPPDLPIIGPYWESGSIWEYTIALSELPECFIVVAYAKIKDVATNNWVEIFGKSLEKTSGYYLNYCVQTCPPPPLGGCETAYAYGDTLANCFIDIQGVNANNWGWSNGPTYFIGGVYDWPIYAGAGQCNIDHGTLVGTLHAVVYPPYLDVTYIMNPGYGLNETHLYAGIDILPMKQGKYTTAPGQFPYKHTGLNGAATDEFHIVGGPIPNDGSIYIVAHAEVCGMY